MNTITPIIINTEPDKCPSCGKNEDVKIVCKHCGFEYEETKNTWRETLSIVVFCAVAVWLFFTLMAWFATRDTLVEILVSQFEWITKLFKRIY